MRNSRICRKVSVNYSNNTCEIKVSGAGDLKAKDLICRDIKANISGAGDLDMKGKAETGEYKVSGSGDIHAHATERLYARASGSGDIKYKGDPRNDTRSTGVGDIKRIK